MTSPMMPPSPKINVNPPALLTAAKTIAVVGFSADPNKPSHRAPMELVRRGWNVIPINPTVDSIAGLKSYPSLADVPTTTKIDLVDVFRPAHEAPAIATQAAAVGAKTLWLQKGIVSDAARQIAGAAGMSFVEDTCAGATASQLNLFPDAPAAQ